MQLGFEKLIRNWRHKAKDIEANYNIGGKKDRKGGRGIWVERSVEGTKVQGLEFLLIHKLKLFAPFGGHYLILDSKQYPICCFNNWW